MKKYKDKYRIGSLRLQGYDYSSAGLYFITICTKSRISCFGSIKDGYMNLNPIGHIVADEWQKTEEIRGRVTLGECIVMPNHLHGIIYLEVKSQKNCRDALHASQNQTEDSNPDRFNLETGDGRSPSLHKHGDAQNYKNKFGPQRDNISSIIRGFKSTCTRKIRKSSFKSFVWQKGFYDHIIRNQESLLKIEQYIRENPYLWHQDRYYS